MTLAVTRLASDNIGSRLMVISTGSERSTEMFWLVPAGSGFTSICTRRAPDSFGSLPVWQPQNNPGRVASAK